MDLWQCLQSFSFSSQLDHKDEKTQLHLLDSSTYNIQIKWTYGCRTRLSVLDFLLNFLYSENGKVSDLTFLP